jgi:hypothetical protein
MRILEQSNFRWTKLDFRDWILTVDNRPEVRYELLGWTIQLYPLGCIQSVPR